MRSLSFTRSSPAPVTCSSPPWLAQAARAGISSMRYGTWSAPSVNARGAPVANTHAARRLAAGFALDVLVDDGAAAAQHVEQRDPRRVEPDVLDLDVGARNRGGGGDPERRRRNVARHHELAAAQRLAARDLNRVVRRRAPWRRTRAARARCDCASRPTPRRPSCPRPAGPASSTALFTWALGTSVR